MPELVAQGAGQVVDAVEGVRMRLEKACEQLGGDVLHAQPEGEAAEVVGELVLLRQQLKGGVVALQRVAQVAGLVPRDAEQPPGMAAAFVELQRLQGRLRGDLGLFGLQRVEGLAQERLGRQGLQLADCGVEAGERLGRSALAGSAAGELGARGHGGLFGKQGRGGGQSLGADGRRHAGDSVCGGAAPASVTYA